MTNVELTRQCRDLFVKAADALAEAGAHPVAIIEGALCAALNMSEQAMGSAALAFWLRDAANAIEAKVGKADGKVTLQ